MRDSACVIMAAGLGKRMAVPVPKVLLTVQGKPLVNYVVETALAAGLGQIVVVVGHGREQVKNALAEFPVTLAVQEEQLGTAHAVIQALPALRPSTGLVLTMSGDSPLVRPATLSRLVALHKKKANAATVLTAEVPDPTGYGRIVRNEAGEIVAIVEDKDCDGSQRQVKEINSSVYCFQMDPLFGALGMVRNVNVQGEYYLTDVIGILRDRGQRVGAVTAPDWREVLGANNPDELAVLESVMALRERGSAR